MPPLYHSPQGISSTTCLQGQLSPQAKSHIKSAIFLHPRLQIILVPLPATLIWKIHPYSEARPTIEQLNLPRKPRSNGTKSPRVVATEQSQCAACFVNLSGRGGQPTRTACSHPHGSAGRLTTRAICSCQRCKTRVWMDYPNQPAANLPLPRKPVTVGKR